MISSRAVGAGAFVLVGVVLFTVAMFMIGSRRMLFADRSVVYSEFRRLGQLESGATVRVAGLDAGEVTEIQVPQRPSAPFRVRMEVRDDLLHLIRQDSTATTQTEGLVGAVYVNIVPGTDASPVVAEGGTIEGRDPFQLADLLQQASGTISMVSQTVELLREDIVHVIAQVGLTAQEANALITDIRPDITAVATSGARISEDAESIVSSIRSGEGTLGKLIYDDTLYQRVRDILDESKSVMENVRATSAEVQRAVSDFRSEDGPALGLVSDMRVTLAQAREATSDLADNMEAMKHNFLLRGFFNRRGYFDLDAISPAQYQSGVLENGRRKAMRIWLGAEVLFETGRGGEEVLSAGGRARVDSAMATYLRYLPANPVVVEGYATAGTVGDRFSRSRSRATAVREYILSRHRLAPQATGAIALADEATGSPRDDVWDGVAITLFLDRESLQFVDQPVSNSSAPASGTQLEQ